MFVVDATKCIGCQKCVKDCFTNDIEMINQKARIKNDNCIKCGHCVAVCPENAVYTDEYDMNDVLEYDKKYFDIEEERLLNFIKFRRTVRQFKDKDVSDEDIIKIIEAGRFTQTALNMQLVSYTVVKKGLQELKRLAIESLKNKAESILAGVDRNEPQLKWYADFWNSMYEEFQIDPRNGDRLFFNAPVIIVISANTEINGALASSNMELMTQALGLGTFFSGFFVRAANLDNRISDFLDIKEGQKVVSCMVIGHPNVKYYRTVPRKRAEIVWK